MSSVYSVRRRFTTTADELFARRAPDLDVRIERRTKVFRERHRHVVAANVDPKRETVKPSSSAPPVAETRPPPIVPLSESICAWLAVNLTAAVRFATVQRSLPSNTETEPLLSEAVPMHTRVFESAVDGERRPRRARGEEVR